MKVFNAGLADIILPNGDRVVPGGDANLSKNAQENKAVQGFLKDGLLSETDPKAVKAVGGKAAKGMASVETSKGNVTVASGHAAIVSDLNDAVTKAENEAEEAKKSLKDMEGKIRVALLMEEQIDFSSSNVEAAVNALVEAKVAELSKATDATNK